MIRNSCRRSAVRSFSIFCRVARNDSICSPRLATCSATRVMPSPRLARYSVVAATRSSRSVVDCSRAARCRGEIVSVWAVTVTTGCHSGTRSLTTSASSWA
ncbi:MAG: hypothetical protein EA420_08145 [Candidatus Competibacteraceae bacterium]|nr:MAG: hypothetical protein EA420_08145 [Candidatus Competibacteraceae bacterium]